MAQLSEKLHTPQGYYRFPTVYKDTVVFVSEDDLWSVPLAGGRAIRLSSSVGELSRPEFSPDGKWLAFNSKEEGHIEVYVMPASGGQAKRLTYLAADSRVFGWKNSNDILFSSTADQFHGGLRFAYSISIEGGEPQKLPTGSARSVSYSANGGCVLVRNIHHDASAWKRYRGGTVGEIWIDQKGSGEFVKFTKANGNLNHPLWIGDKIYFFSDHEGHGNIYSCTPAGENIHRHTHHEDFYVKHLSTDGQHIVYSQGSDLWAFNIAKNSTQKISIDFKSSKTQTQRKFIDADKYLENYVPHPQGHLLAFTCRGKAFTMGNWEGPAIQFGEGDGARYRFASWLPDGKRLVAVSDAQGEERLEVFHLGEFSPHLSLSDIDFGRAAALKVSPVKDQVAILNHRNEIVVIDLESKKSKIIDRTENGFMFGFNWSPDGQWIAYSYPLYTYASIIRVYNVETNVKYDVTKPIRKDYEPSFDPEGKYLYFLSTRVFNPIYDTVHFELGFPKSTKPYLVTLKKETASPFVLTPQPLEEKKADEKSQAPVKVDIDFEGISDRVLSFPVPEALYEQIAGLNGKVLFSFSQPEGALSGHWFSPEPPAKSSLDLFDFATQKTERIVEKLTNFSVSSDVKTLVYRMGSKLRVLKASEKPDETSSKEEPGRKSGWVELNNRVKVSILPLLEWKQMYREAWRLQRDHFWTEDMSEVDWKEIFQRYLPLTDRLGSRSEYADLIWDMQGELGTSHAYEIGGDYRKEPNYPIGFLGADFKYNSSKDSYVIEHIAHGDSWEEQNFSPLMQPGLNISRGDTLLAINGRKLGKHLSPAQMLVHQAGNEVILSIGDSKNSSIRHVTVKTLPNQTLLRYREWVETNRRYVSDKSKGRVGYIHIPNMAAWGYSEFHRYYFTEYDKDALIVDVRFNGGGHVSALLLEKLARKRIGYSKSRWMGLDPYPGESVKGPLVAITNEFAGSDGDIFSHSFKLMKLGPLVGKRTWGGVVGIWPRTSFADKSITTQPEFSFWFKDVGWGVENYGTMPDIEVEMRPQDYVQGKDPQLDRSLEEAFKQLETYKPISPELEKRPSLKAPKLKENTV